MSGEVKGYNSGDVNFSFAGIPFDSGLADGEFLRFEKVNPDNEVYEGTDGSVVVSQTRSRLWKITLRLNQASDHNAQLSAIRTLGLLGANLAGAGPMLLEDKNGTTLFVSDKAWISKPANMSYDRTVKEREWELMCTESLPAIIGGNA